MVNWDDQDGCKILSVFKVNKGIADEKVPFHPVGRREQ
jgi:hypothetical protein